LYSKNCDVLRWQVSLYRRKSNSRCLPRRGSILLKFFGSFASQLTQGPRERKSTADLTDARMLQLQELGLAATATNTLDNEIEPQGFPKEHKKNSQA
jgi:hypothetical protein